MSLRNTAMALPLISVAALACPAPGADDEPQARCDVRALARLTTPEAPRRERAIQAAQHIVASCEGALWEPARELLGEAVFAAERELPPREGLRDVPDKIDAEWDKTLQRACPGLREALERSASAPPEDRNKQIYDDCDFARFGVLEPADVPSSPYSGAFIWSIHQFLLDQDVDQELAQALTRSLFDLYTLADADYLPPPDVQVPSGEPTSGRTLSEHDVVVVLTKNEVRLELPAPGTGRRESVAVGDVNADWLLLLRQALAEAGHGPPADGGEATGPDAVLVADAETPFPRVYSALDSLAGTNLRWFGVLVEVAPFEYRVLDLGPPSPNTASIYEGFPVGITHEGFSFSHRIDIAMRDGIHRVDGQLDYDALAETARQRVGGDVLARVRLLGEDAVPLQEVTRTIEAVRGPGCDAQGATNCVYSRVSLEQWNWR